MEYHAVAYLDMMQQVSSCSVSCQMSISVILQQIVRPISSPFFLLHFMFFFCFHLFHWLKNPNFFYKRIHRGVTGNKKSHPSCLPPSVSTSLNITFACFLPSYLLCLLPSFALYCLLLSPTFLFVSLPPSYIPTCLCPPYFPSFFSPYLGFY